MNLNLHLGLASEDPWELAIAHDALYECPKDATGKRLGPLVVYAGKAEEDGKNYIGDVYFNFAKIEEVPDAVMYYASLLAAKLMKEPDFKRATSIVGIPDGGRTLGFAVALLTGKRFVYPTKKVKPAQASSSQKEEYDLIFKRMELFPAESVIVLDDVHNNFGNTHIALDAINGAGAVAVGLCSALNRSMTVDSEYTPDKGAYLGVTLPVVSAVRRAIPEFRQTDPEVAVDVQNGNIEWGVKKNWARLKEAMARAR